MKTGIIFLYDNENGRKWEYYKTTNGYYMQYWELYRSTGWRKIGCADEICKEDYHEALSISVSSDTIIG